MHFQKYIFKCLLTCMFQLMALNNKHNICLCSLHYIDADYAIIMILIGLSKWRDIWMNNTLILVICALSVGGVFLRRDSKHKNCAIREQGGKNLKFVSRNNYQFGEEEKEQYNKFKKESRELVITIENTCTSNNTQTIVPSEVTVNEKKEQKKEKDNKKG